MSKIDKVYRIYHVASVCSFVLHICVFALVVVAGFLPYRENENFYQVFNGYFGNMLSSVQPFLLLSVLLFSCVLSFFVISRPHLVLLVGLSTFVFFLLATWPASFENAFLSFFLNFGELSVPTYGIGFELIGIASYLVYFDFAFVVYILITIFVTAK